MQLITLSLICILIASVVVMWNVYIKDIETFVDNSGSNIPLNKKDLLNKAIELIRSEISGLKSINSHDPLILARIQNMTKLRDKLQRMYADLIAGKITDDDVDFTEADLANFLTGSIPTNTPGINPSIFNELSNTLKALHDSSIYWQMEIGLQNYNPRPSPIVQYSRFPSITSQNSNEENDVMTRGGNGTAGPNITLSEPFASPDNSWFSFGYDVKTTPAEIDMFDYKHRLKHTCDAIRSGQLGKAEIDFGCPGSDVSKDFDYEGRYKMVCERLGYTWGAGYQQMLGCPGNN